jgi:hypothetical protein
VVEIQGLVAGYRLRGGSVTNEYDGVKRDFVASFFLCCKTATFVSMNGWIKPSPSSNYSTCAVVLKYSTEAGSLFDCVKCLMKDFVLFCIRKKIFCLVCLVFFKMFIIT